MAKYNNQTVTTAKKLMAARLQFVLTEKLQSTSQRALSDRIGMSTNIISKLSRGIGKNISFDAMLELSQRLDLNYKLVMSYDSNTGRSDVELMLEPLTLGFMARMKEATHKLFTPNLVTKHAL